MAGKGATPPPLAETPHDWTELVQTRISPAARAKLEERLAAETMKPSLAHYVRVLIYKDLGIVKEKK
jgi:hypothetical protein